MAKGELLVLLMCHFSGLFVSVHHSVSHSHDQLLTGVLYHLKPAVGVKQVYSLRAWAAALALALHSLSSRSQFEYVHGKGLVRILR